MPTPFDVCGHCLCGKVEVSAQAQDHTVGACHCGTCRTWGGGPFMSLQCDSGVNFKGESFIKVFDSSDWAERGFCQECGSHLFYRLKDHSQYFIPAGLFDESKLALDHQVFIDSKPEYYQFANKTHDLTGEQIFAMFSND